MAVQVSLKVWHGLRLLGSNDCIKRYSPYFFALAGYSDFFDFVAYAGWIKKGTLVQVFKENWCKIAVKARLVSLITTRSRVRLRVSSHFASLW